MYYDENFKNKDLDFLRQAAHEYEVRIRADFVQDYIYEEHGLKINRQEALEIANDMTHRINDNNSLADDIGFLERECIDQAIENKKAAKSQKPKRRDNKAHNMRQVKGGSTQRGVAAPAKNINNGARK